MSNESSHNAEIAGGPIPFRRSQVKPHNTGTRLDSFTQAPISGDKIAN